MKESGEKVNCKCRNERNLGVFQHEAFDIMSLRMVHCCELPENGVRVDGQW